MRRRLLTVLAVTTALGAFVAPALAQPEGRGERAGRGEARAAAPAPAPAPAAAPRPAPMARGPEGPRFAPQGQRGAAFQGSPGEQRFDRAQTSPAQRFGGGARFEGPRFQPGADPRFGAQAVPDAATAARSADARARFEQERARLNENRARYDADVARARQDGTIGDAERARIQADRARIEQTQGRARLDYDRARFGADGRITDAERARLGADRARVEAGRGAFDRGGSGQPGYGQPRAAFGQPGDRVTYDRGQQGDRATLDRGQPRDRSAVDRSRNRLSIADRFQDGGRNGRAGFIPPIAGADAARARGFVDPSRPRFDPRRDAGREYNGERREWQRAGGFDRGRFEGRDGDRYRHDYLYRDWRGGDRDRDRLIIINRFGYRPFGYGLRYGFGDYGFGGGWGTGVGWGFDLRFGYWYGPRYYDPGFDWWYGPRAAYQYGVSAEELVLRDSTIHDWALYWFDRDRDGYLDRDEVRDAARAIRRMADYDDNGFIDAREYRSIVERLREPADRGYAGYDDRGYDSRGYDSRSNDGGYDDRGYDDGRDERDGGPQR